MPSLAEMLLDDAKKASVVDDCLALIDAEVADKSGLSGLAIKAGYGVVKGVKPGFVKQAVTDLLPEFANALDPIYQEAKAKGRPITEYFNENSGRVADALLAITDEKAKKSKSAAVKGAYDKLRGSAKKNVEQAVPRLSRMISKYGA